MPTHRLQGQVHSGSSWGRGHSVRRGKGSAAAEESSCFSHSGPYIFCCWAPLPRLAPAWLQAPLCPRGLCDLGPARQWGRGTGKLSPCGQVPSGQISQGQWELWVGMEAPQAGALVSGPGMTPEEHWAEAFSSLLPSVKWARSFLPSWAGVCVRGGGGGDNCVLVESSRPAL